MAVNKYNMCITRESEIEAMIRHSLTASRIIAYHDINPEVFYVEMINKDGKHIKDAVLTFEQIGKLKKKQRFWEDFYATFFEIIQDPPTTEFDPCDDISDEEIDKITREEELSELYIPL